MFAFWNARFTVMTSTSSSSTRRILITRSSMACPRLLGPAEKERCTATRCRFDPRAAAACLDDLANNRQTDACAFDLVARFERLEQLPDACVALRLDAAAV